MTPSPTAGVTAWRALVVDGGLRPGDVVLALGTGGVAVYAVQLAQAMGATVVATSSSEEKLARRRRSLAEAPRAVREMEEAPHFGKIELEH